MLLISIFFLAHYQNTITCGIKKESVKITVFIWGINLRSRTGQEQEYYQQEYNAQISFLCLQPYRKKKPAVTTLHSFI